MATELAHAWAGMVAALEELAPLSAAMIRPPEPRAVARLEAAVEADLTDELREWFTLHGGTPARGAGDIGVGARLVPHGYLTSVDEAIEYDAGWRDARQSIFNLEPGQSFGEAGEANGVWIPQYILVACDQGDGWTFVDTRAGSRQGWVGNFVKGDGDTASEPGYPNLTALVDAVIRSLRHGDTVDGYWYATVADGKLDWEPIDLGPPPTPPNSRWSGPPPEDESASDTESSTGAGRGPLQRLTLPTRREK